MTDLLQHIEGLHEIHITTHPKDLFALRMYCIDNNPQLKPILAVSQKGDSPIQPMFSKFKNGTALEVIERANYMATIMQDYGIRVTRVKVESMMHNIGVPTEENTLCSPDNYFEFHLKIEVANSSEWIKLDKCCSKYNAHLSFNAFKKETVPLVTLRLPGNLGSKKAIEIKNDLMIHLKDNGFHSNSSIQSEFSVYDNNQSLDKGWLI
jgi:hypothetical protein